MQPETVSRHSAGLAALLVLSLTGCAYFGGPAERAEPMPAEETVTSDALASEPGADTGAAPETQPAGEAAPANGGEFTTAEPATAEPATGDAAPAESTDAAPPAAATPPPADDTVALKETAPLRYVVKKGDTLWDISNFYLQDPWQWPELWYANPQVENPHLIYPGDELMLITIDGRPRLVREVAEVPTPIGPATPSREGTVQPQARVSDLAQAIPTIPLDAIRAFLRGPRVIDKDELDDAPYVLDFEEDHLISGSDSTAYVLNLEDRSHTQYQIVRLGQQYRDPDDNDIIGYEALPVADAEVRVFGEPASVYITRSDIETRVGDHLLPVDEEALLSSYMPRAPEKAVDGTIIAMYNGNTQIGQYQIVALNRGTDHGLAPGHVLTIWQAGRKAKDPYSFFGSKVELPAVRAGTVMVFKTRERLSYALVMQALRTIYVMDKVEKPESQR